MTQRQLLHVYLDDYRPCPAGFALARSAEECLLLLRECEIGILSLDFDLGWGQPNGLSVARAIVMERLYPRAAIYLHSSNPSARSRMMQELHPSLPDGVRLFGAPMPEDIKRVVAAGGDVFAFYRANEETE
ncbi:cyclic-phosphate processing receiver domain-containing protein [Paenibacillus thermoaerophilus]|uniref:Cyclic-phosphate processing receiver domain-containing protein n=1 Tax=Paenibacillus thermoaerophilus TaxID=1215385 RepID=A0ABW2V3Q9_9BACL|nr:cyclic-phosphate processing receiver domain-containing protein [Paenibacillus thermoaerophilus]TMV17138.1 cell division protein FtsJ [Paenibacillus thermoaerophilus]